MKKILMFSLAVLALAAAPRAQACSLTEEDKASIKNAIKPTFKDTLPTSGEDLKNMCLARDLVRRNKNGQLSQITRAQIPVGLSRFVTDEEYDDSFRDAVLTVLAQGYPGSRAA
jgi:hypothetical protein